MLDSSGSWVAQLFSSEACSQILLQLMWRRPGLAMPEQARRQTGAADGAGGDIARPEYPFEAEYVYLRLDPLLMRGLLCKVFTGRQPPSICRSREARSRECPRSTRFSLGEFFPVPGGGHVSSTSRRLEALRFFKEGLRAVYGARRFRRFERRWSRHSDRLTMRPARPEPLTPNPASAA